MALDIWEQREWHGISRQGVGRTDPFGSKTELNTCPGENEFKKIHAREPFTSAKLPIPAVYFNDKPVYWGLYDNAGAAVSKPFSATTSSFVVQCIFQIPDLLEYYTTIYPTIFSAGHSPGTTTWAWGFYLDWNAVSLVWELKFQVRRAAATYITVTSSEVLESGAWYSATAFVNKNAGSEEVTLNVYKNGSLTPTTDADATATYDTFTGTYYVYIGGYGYDENYFRHGAVAFASLRENESYSDSPWYADMGVYNVSQQHDVYFFIHDAKREIQPATIGDSVTGYQWRALPVRSVRYATDTSIMNARGVLSTAGRSYKVTLPEGPLFKQKTVFTFLFDCNEVEGVTLLRSEDSSFVVSTVTGAVTVVWTPADPAAGSTAYGRMNAWSRTSFYTSGAVTWIAVVVDPTCQDGQNNVEIYKYATDTDTWVTTGGSTSGVQVGRGIIAPNSNVFFLNHCYHDDSSLYDFRMIVGDESWNTNHTTETMMSSVPKGLVSWLSCDVTTRWPRQDNVQESTFPHRSGYAPQVIAVADRIDGIPRYQLDTHSPLMSYTGTDYVSYGSMPARVTDAFLDSGGKVSAATDSYYLDKETATPKYREITEGYSQVAAVGSHRYIVGPAPLQVVAQRPALVGIRTPRIICECPTSEAACTIDYKGQLSWSTTYKYKVTLYDPRTGTESNPAGAFRFTSDGVPTTTTVVYGTIGCAVTVNAYIYENVWCAGLHCRFYRYHDGDGTYYLEGESPIVFSSGNLFSSSFVFAMTDDELSLQPEIQYDNDPPPWHTASFIWNSRAWFVDALQPSRLYISKELQLGSVPPENMLWTDEGIGGDILGFLPGFNGLLLLRERSIWIIPYFQTSDAAYAQPLIPDVGCASGRSAVFAEGTLWFAAPSGLHSFDGQTLTNHSERLGGLDRKVWDHAPGLTTCYYNRNDWKVTFACDGSGLSIDIRNGAVSLCSAPEYCCTTVATSSYSGPLYGGDGEVWKENSTANNSLTLDRNGAMATSAKDYRLLATYPLANVNLDWNDGVASGAAFIGWRGSIFSGATAGWLSSASFCGRSLTLVDGNIEDAFTLPLGYWASPSAMLVRTKQSQTGMGNLLIDNTLCYYEGQDVFLSRHRQASIYERMDLFASDFVNTSASLTGAFFVLTSSGQSMSSSFSTIVFNEDSVYQVPIRLRGQQFYYYLRVVGSKSFPNIRSIGVHFRLCRERSRE